MKRIACPGILIFALALFSAPSLHPQEADTGDFVRDYRIGAKDLLEIKVFELPELNQTVRVSEDGSITLPLLGRVEIRGMTQNELEKRLAELLEEKYLRNARVSVFIREYRSTQVAIIGAVGKPGMYELVGRRNLLQMISLAGGFRENAANELYVLREGESGIAASIAIDLDDLLVNGNQKLNIPLQPNDVVNVPADRIIHVYVFGRVRNPGALQVRMSRGINLLQAIAQAGGLADGASRRGVTVKRKDPKTGREIEIKVNLRNIIRGRKPDIELLEGDVVFVRERFF